MDLELAGDGPRALTNVRDAHARHSGLGSAKLDLATSELACDPDRGQAPGQDKLGGLFVLGEDDRFGVDALDHVPAHYASLNLQRSELSKLVLRWWGRRNLEKETIQLTQIQIFKAELFKALSHPTRIRILELLRGGEMTVSRLQAGLGAEGSTVSQQLAILRMKNLVETRREGTAIYYRLRDPQIIDLLDAARRIFEAHVIELQSMTEAETAAI